MITLRVNCRFNAVSHLVSSFFVNIFKIVTEIFCICKNVSYLYIITKTKRDMTTELKTKIAERIENNDMTNIIVFYNPQDDCEIMYCPLNKLFWATNSVGNVKRVKTLKSALKFTGDTLEDVKSFKIK